MAPKVPMRTRGLLVENNKAPAPCSLLSMFVIAGFAGLGLLVSLAQAQSSASAYVEPSVPTGTPIPGDYTGALRPQIHYSPPRGFMVRLAPALSAKRYRCSMMYNISSNPLRRRA
ncbi:MAG: hypothetical protein Q9181_000341 [Wetmoreana brouardii]